MVEDPFKKRLIHELYLFAILLFIGYIVLPVAIYFVGGAVFGAYEDGYAAFFAGLTRNLAGLSGVYWFLVLSPWLSVQTLRLTWFGLRRLKR